MKRLFVFIFLALRICCGQSWAANAPDVNSMDSENQEASGKWERAKLEILLFSTVGTSLWWDPIANDAHMNHFKFLEGFVVIVQKFRHYVPLLGKKRPFEISFSAGANNTADPADADSLTPSNPYFGWKALAAVSASINIKLVTTQVSFEQQFGKANESLFRVGTRAIAGFTEARALFERDWRQFPPDDVDVIGGNLGLGINLSSLVSDDYLAIPSLQKGNWEVRLFYFAHMETQEIDGKRYARITPHFGGPMIEAYNSRLHLFVEALAEWTRTEVWSYSPLMHRWDVVSDTTQAGFRISVSENFSLW